CGRGGSAGLGMGGVLSFGAVGPFRSWGAFRFNGVFGSGSAAFGTVGTVVPFRSFGPSCLGAGGVGGAGGTVVGFGRAGPGLRFRWGGVVVAPFVGAATAGSCGARGAPPPAGVVSNLLRARLRARCCWASDSCCVRSGAASVVSCTLFALAAWLKG